MKIQELVEFVGNNKNKMLKTAQLEESIAKKLEVKKYIGIKDKKALIESIVNECILFEDGVFKFDDIDKYICFTMRTIEAYTNLELSDDIEVDYDLLCENGLLNVVIDTFNGEYENVKILLQMKCDYILSDNSIEAQIGKFLSNISGKIDTFADALSSKVNDFSFDDLPVSKEDLGRLLEFVSNNK